MPPLALTARCRGRWPRNGPYTRREWLVPVEPGGGRTHRVFKVWTYPVRDGTGAVVRLVEIFRDITEHELLRETEQHAEALRGGSPAGDGAGGHRQP